MNGNWTDRQRSIFEWNRALSFHHCCVVRVSHLLHAHFVAWLKIAIVWEIFSPCAHVLHAAYLHENTLLCMLYNLEDSGWNVRLLEKQLIIGQFGAVFSWRNAQIELPWHGSMLKTGPPQNNSSWNCRILSISAIVLNANHHEFVAPIVYSI